MSQRVRSLVAIAAVMTLPFPLLAQEKPTPPAGGEPEAGRPAGEAPSPRERSLSAEEDWEMRPTPTPYPPMTCAEAVEKGIFAAAVEPCRQELAQAPDDTALMRLAASAEFAEGDPYRSAELWGKLLDRAGWDDEAARGRAMALWRAGEIASAEELLRERVERGPAVSSCGDLVDFLLGFDRFTEAAEVATAASKALPGECRFLEDQGVAEAGLNHDAKAAELIGRAVAAGCPRYRWTTRGVLAGRIADPPYRPLLKPRELVDRLAELDDAACLQRFRLLQPVLVAEVAPAVTDQILSRTTAEVRLAGLGLLATLGPAAVDSFGRLLAADDFILRKRALRGIRELHQPAFVPLLEKHLQRESLPHNKTLTMLALGELLLDGDRAAEGERMLLAIPKDDPLHPVARLELAERAEKRGDLATARTLVEEALAADPKIYLDPARRERLGIPAPSPPPTPAAPDTGEQD